MFVSVTSCSPTQWDLCLSCRAQIMTSTIKKSCSQSRSASVGVVVDVDLVAVEVDDFVESFPAY